MKVEETEPGKQLHKKVRCLMSTEHKTARKKWESQGMQLFLLQVLLTMSLLFSFINIPEKDTETSHCVSASILYKIYGSIFHYLTFIRLFIVVSAFKTIYQKHILSFEIPSKPRAHAWNE